MKKETEKMDQKNFSKPLSLAKVQVTDAFWKKEMELVRTEVIPYQWNALNDNVPGAAPSFCMRNYRRAGEVEKERKAKGDKFVQIKYPLDTFETLPKDGKMDGRFYGIPIRSWKKRQMKQLKLSAQHREKTDTSIPTI